MRYGEWKSDKKFLYIDDCIKGTDLLFKSKYRQPINIGNDKHVTINKLVSILEKISNIKLKEFMIPQNQRRDSRSSDNTLVKKILNWSPETSTEKYRETF